MNDDLFQRELEVDNPAEFLRNESGTFEVMSPYGQVFCVTCRRGARMNVRQIGDAKGIENREQMTWKIRRVDHAVA